MSFTWLVYLGPGIYANRASDFRRIMHLHKFLQFHRLNGLSGLGGFIRFVIQNLGKKSRLKLAYLSGDLLLVMRFGDLQFISHT